MGIEWMGIGGKGNVESYSRTSLIEVAERSRVRVSPTALSIMPMSSVIYDVIHLEIVHGGSNVPIEGHC